jgi:hypothetical protein
MAKFVKIKTGEGEILSWQKLIENEEDILPHNDVMVYTDSVNFLHHSSIKGDKFSTTSTNPRDTRIIDYMNARRKSSKQGEKTYPIFLLAEVLDGRLIGMIKTFRACGNILVREGGGYCGLDVFLKIWHGEIVETLITKGEGFPKDESHVSADTLILENSNECSPETFKEIRDLLGSDAGDIQAITSLRSVSTDYILKSLQEASNVWIETQLINMDQLDKFMELFTHIKGKNVYLKMPMDEYEMLREHRLYRDVSIKHQINLVK